MVQNKQCEALETVSFELMVYLNMLFQEWMKQVPALQSLVPVNEKEEYFSSSTCRIHESEKSEHLYFDGPLAGFQVSVDLDEDGDVALYTLKFETEEKKLTYKMTDMVALAKKMAMLAFGHVGSAFVDCETRIFENTGPR